MNEGQKNNLNIQAFKKEKKRRIKNQGFKNSGQSKLRSFLMMYSNLLSKLVHLCAVRLIEEKYTRAKTNPVIQKGG
jgi:hypothetical protein